MDKETRNLFAAAGVPLAEEDWDFFARLRERILEANRRMNLTRITEPREFFSKHVLDSVLPFFLVPELKALPRRLLAADIGSGAGFPGLALARLNPRWDVALIERTQKKAVFLEETIEELGIGNAYVVPFDAGEAPRHAKVLRRGCRLVVARAVGRIAAVTALAAPLLGTRGVIVHYKGGQPEEAELREGKIAAGRRRYKQTDPVAYDLPPDARRSVVLVVNRTRRRKRTGPLTRASS